MANFRGPTNINVTTSTGTGAVDLTTSGSNRFRLVAVTAHASAAVTGAIEVSLDAKDGEDYDVLLSSTATGWTDSVYLPESDFIFEEGDEINVSCANSGSATIGVRIVRELI